MLWFKKKSPTSPVENKSDPRNIAAEMIALDMIKSKIYPEIKQTYSSKLNYAFQRVLSFANDKKFSFKIINDVPYKNTNRANLFTVDKSEFHKNNGFELTSYGEKILIEAAKKLVKMKEEEDKAKAEHDAKQKAIDFIEKRLGIHKLEATGKINISRFKGMPLSKLEAIWSDPDVSLIYENEELEFIEKEIERLKKIKTPVSSTGKSD